MSQQIGYRICSICEAACGLEVDLDNGSVTAIRANDDDVFSEGHVCAKGIALKELHADADRLRQPLIRGPDGLRPATWDEAWRVIGEKLRHIKDQYGPQAVGVYVGNPTAHNIGLATGLGVFAATLGSSHFFTAGTVDQVPKQLASQLMFGNEMALPVPDILNCDHLLMLGANPLVSNGSLWVVPGIREKIRALKNRGGKLVVVDPRRTETARVASEHIAIRPGSDALLLASIINGLIDRGLGIPAGYQTDGFDLLTAALSRVSLTQTIDATGLAASQINSMIDALQNARHPVVYGRVGTTLQRFGTLTSFLIEIINIMLGALDRRGGAMFPDQPFYQANPSSTSDATEAGIPPKLNRYQSRVSGYAEVLGQMPVVALPEEILTPGDGKLRALVCFAGNPVVSNPDSRRVKTALEALDFLLCIDIYQNETTGLADVILPGTSPFEDSHYDSFLGSMGYRNAARYSPALLTPDRTDEWELALYLSQCLTQTQIPDETSVSRFEDDLVAAAVGDHVADPNSGIYGRDVQEIMSKIEPRRGVERILDLGIRAGKWGDHFGARNGHEKRLTLATVASTPNGIDLGEIAEARLDEVNRHPDGIIRLAPQVILSEIQRLLDTEPDSGFRLIGRRSTRSNNSWLRNLPALGKGKDQCAAQMNPLDAEDLGVRDGSRIRIRSTTGEVEASVELTDTLMRGVVCLPHGFSNEDVSQANHLKGPNYNELAPADLLDVPTSTAALNGIPVEIFASRTSAISGLE